jgi:hypothetical protein
MTDITPEKMTDNNDPAESGQTGTETPLGILIIPQPTDVPTNKNITPGRRPLFRSQFSFDSRCWGTEL